MISIPDPCSEDFSKMTATVRGAFCSKCQIDTFDFRDVSDYDINKIILQNKGKHLCGQFKGSQLNSLNQGFINWKNQKGYTFRSKFVLALVMVFGLSLFSCNVQEEKTIVDLQAIEMIGNPTDKMEYINLVQNEQELDLTTFVEEVREIECSIPVPEVVIYEEYEGIEEVIHPDIITGGLPDFTILGGGISSVVYFEYLEDTVELIADESILPEVIDFDPDYFEAKAFPNPTTGDATLALEIQEAGQFEILVYDLSGRLVQSIYSGELLEGRQNFQVELAQENSGIYLVKILSNNQNETIKIQKLN